MPQCTSSIECPSGLFDLPHQAYPQQHALMSGLDNHSKVCGVVTVRGNTDHATHCTVICFRPDINACM